MNEQLKQEGQKWLILSWQVEINSYSLNLEVSFQLDFHDKEPAWVVL